MEYNLEPKSVGVICTCLDNVCEQAVDLDLTLPDYCPDIEKILKCSLTPHIFSKNLTGGQLVIEGASVLEVLYVDAVKKNIRCCEQSVPFSAVFNLKEPVGGYVISASTKTEYLNCRALSPRKLVLHGAFSLYAGVFTKNEEKIFVKPQDASDIETREEKVEYCSVVALCQEQFSLSEDISVTNKPPVEAMLEKKLSLNLAGVKVIPGKVLINGEVSVKLLYLSDLESGVPNQLDYLFPFERIIDCEEVTGDSVVVPEINLMSYDIRLKNDILSDSPAISVDVKAEVGIKAYDYKDAMIISDGYSTKYYSEPHCESPRILKSITPFCENLMHKATVDLGETKISRVIDLSCDNFTATPVVSEKGVTITGKGLVCILAYDAENAPCYIERIIEFEHIFTPDKEFTNVSDVFVKPKSVSYRISDDTTLDIRFEMTACAKVTHSFVCRCVSALNCMEDKPVLKPSCPLTLYYAKQGESLWNIAKCYNTKTELLLQENSLEGDLLESPRMLLIPGI